MEGNLRAAGFSSGSSQDQGSCLGTRSRRGELRTLLHKGYDFRQWFDLQPVPANLHAIPIMTIVTISKSEPIHEREKCNCDEKYGSHRTD